MPEGDVRLGDGRLLKRLGAYPDRRMRDALLEQGFTAHTIDHMEGSAYEGPKHLTVIATIDDGPHGKLLHVSVSYRQHLPSWRDMRTIRDAFYPDTVDVMLVLPRREHYVDVHPNCLHMQQCPVGWGIM